MALPKTSLLVRTFDALGVPLAGDSSEGVETSAGVITITDQFQGDSTEGQETSDGQLVVIANFDGDSTEGAETSDGVISIGEQPPYGFAWCTMGSCITAAFDVESEMDCCP